MTIKTIPYDKSKGYNGVNYSVPAIAEQTANEARFKKFFMETYKPYVHTKEIAYLIAKECITRNGSYCLLGGDCWYLVSL
jgi:hypothetical protein